LKFLIVFMFFFIFTYLLLLQPFSFDQPMIYFGFIAVTFSYLIFTTLWIPFYLEITNWFDSRCMWNPKLLRCCHDCETKFPIIISSWN
jgi:hypothetical protein